MIQSKKEYKYYLAEDLRHYQIPNYSISHFIKNPILRFQRRLRKIEYLTNCKSNNLFLKIYCKCLHILNTRLAIRLGFTIPINTIGPGLCFPHYGTIIITHNCSIGKNCRIHPGTAIGTYHGAPTIGDNVYIGPGAKLFGDLKIGNNVSIGANSVITKSFEDNVSIAGIPASIISHKTTFELGMYPKGFLEEPTSIVSSES
jgi:serine O-acetyltransferase